MILFLFATVVIYFLLSVALQAPWDSIVFTIKLIASVVGGLIISFIL